MTTFRAVWRIPRVAALVPVLLIGMAACSSSGRASGAPSTTVVPLGAPAGSGSTGSGSSGPASTDPAGPTTMPEGPIQIDVLIGTDDSPTRVENASLGSSVTINVTDPTIADQFHLHGYDIEQSVDANVTATFNFVANQAGTFELESHTTGNVLMILQVG